MKKTRILLADDHTIVAEGLVSLLEPDFDLVGRVDNGRDLLKKAEELSPDISMPLLNGIEALRQLKKAKPDVRVVFLTVHADVSYITEAFRAGAAGYVLKQSAAEELRLAIKAVHEGRTYLTPLITKDFLNDIFHTGEGVDSVNVTLTPREREVLQLLAEGHEVKEIAAVLITTKYPLLL